jgi:hypothetical protein
MRGFVARESRGVVTGNSLDLSGQCCTPLLFTGLSTAEREPTED